MKFKIIHTCGLPGLTRKLAATSSAVDSPTAAAVLASVFFTVFWGVV